MRHSCSMRSAATMSVTQRPWLYRPPTARSLNSSCADVVLGVDEEFFFHDVDAEIARCLGGNRGAS